MVGACLMAPITMISPSCAQGASDQPLSSPPDNQQPAVPPPSPSVPQSQAQPPLDPTKPIPPGGIRIITRNPDPGKWGFVPGVQANASRTFNCKPLACADAARVIITNLRSPTRNPDPQALEKFAKVDFPKAIRAQNAAQDVLSDGANKIETLSSKTARLKDYPAVLNETKFTAGKKVVFINTAIIFAGPSMLKLASISPNKELAQKSLDEFVAAVDIKEGPPLPAPSMPKPPDSLPPDQKPQNL
ncbi:MAG: hypothetical protein QOE39_602 [Bradyrhizobium sp.]|nr:hypothetical protein [Bradyrhizobium sp.]